MAIVNVQCGDLLTQPGVADVVVSYAGDTTLVLGRPIVISAAATAGGTAVGNARFSASVSDTSIAVVHGDSLIPMRRGAADLTVALSSSLLPGAPPSVTHRLRVVVDTVVTDSTAITFRSIGDTARVVGTALDFNGDPVTATVRYSVPVSDTSIVAVSNTGLITAKKNGTATVRAALDDDTADVAITVAQTLSHYTFAAGTLTADALSDTLFAIAVPRDARGNVILLGGNAPTWSIVDPTLGQLNAATGRVISLRNGSTFLKATHTAGSVTVVDSVAYVVDQHAVQVLIYPSPLPALSSLGQQLQLSARGLDRNGQDVQDAVPSWFTQTPALLSVNSSGLVTTIAIGTGRVLASIDAAVDTAVITISNTPVTVEVTPDTIYANSVGDLLKFRARVLNGLGDSVPGAVVTWSTPDTVVQLLPGDTVLTLLVGRARIIAQSGAARDTGIAIIRNIVDLINIVPTAGFITSLGATDTPQVDIENARGNQLGRTSVAWTSDDPAIVRVSALGVVTAVNVGAAFVRATSGTLTDSILYTVVNNLVPDTVKIIPVQIQFVTLGDTASPPADIKNALGQALPRSTVAWTTDDQTIARVSLQGVVTAVAAGQTIVRAAYANLKDSVLVTVIDQTAPDTLRIIPQQVQLTSLTVEDTPQVEIKNALGATLPRNSVGWTTDDAAIASVTLHGIVTAVGTGQTYIRASSGSLKDSVLYIVSNNPVSIVISGSPLDTLAKIGQQLTYTTDVRNGLGNQITTYPTAWTTSDASQISVDTAGGVATATVVNFGAGVDLIAHAGPFADTVHLVPRDLKKLLVDNTVTVVGPRVGTGLRPYASIQAAVNDADALDTVLVRGTRANPYLENVALFRRVYLIGDSVQWSGSGYNTYYLPHIQHDTGVAAITSVLNAAPQTIQYLVIVHTTNGPAILTDGADVDIQHVYVNPPGTVSSRIGRGFYIKNSTSGSIIQNNRIENVRAYGIKLENTSNLQLTADTIVQVDSVFGEGGAIALIGGGSVNITQNYIANTEGPGVTARGTSSLNVYNQNMQGTGGGVVMDSVDQANLSQDTFLINYGGQSAVRKIGGTQLYVQDVTSSGGRAGVWARGTDVYVYNSHFSYFDTAGVLVDSVGNMYVWQDTFDLGYSSAAFLVRNNTVSKYIQGAVIRSSYYSGEAFRFENSRDVSIYGSSNLVVHNVQTLLHTKNATNIYVASVAADSMSYGIFSEGVDSVYFYNDTLRTMQYYCGYRYDTLGVASLVQFYQVQLENCGSSRGFYWNSQNFNTGAHGPSDLQFYYSKVTVPQGAQAVYFNSGGTFRSDTTEFRAVDSLGTRTCCGQSALLYFYLYDQADPTRQVILTRSVVENNHKGPGVYIYYPWPNTNLYFGGNRITHNGVGMRIYNYQSASMGCYYVCADDIYDNDTLGVYYYGNSAQSYPFPIWWGDGRGPRANNSLATGDSLSQFNLTTSNAAAPHNTGTVATALRIVRGSNQVVAINTQYPKNLTVRVVDADGLPVAGTVVTFTAGNNGTGLSCQAGFTCVGSSSSLDVTSNSSGLAEVRYVSGSTGNTLDDVPASASGLNTVHFVLSTP